ncbi:LysR family transcriptional regulator [Pseudoflavonifractor sp.]|jgi:DNA-binding transcriptional LysR family regulator|uniref:LysR family transcriptional regulator n=1 Tax=Pseudoflavonifractor sp. TaxID=1980281 RepID=UPI003D8BCFA6
MELRQLKYFISAAKHLNFTKAAAECYIVQTSMTHQIAALEDELGVKLFERKSRNMELTEARKIFLKEAQSLLAGAERAAELVRMTAEGYESILRLGVCGKILARELPKILRTFRLAYPAVRVRINQDTLEKQLEMLETGELDCVIALDYDYFDTIPWLKKRTLFQDRVMLAVPKDNPLANREEVRLEDLKNEKFFVFYEKGVGEKTIGCAKEGLVLNVVEEMRSPDAAALMVQAGYGVGFCMECTWDGTDEFVKHVPVRSENSTNGIVLLHKHGNQRAALRQRKEILEQYPFPDKRLD